MTTRGERNWSRQQRRMTGPALSILLGIMVVNVIVAPSQAWAAASSHDHSPGTQGSPGWAEQLKGQTVVKDVMEGHAGRTAMMECQHQRVMEQMQRDATAQRTGGSFNDVNMMHQYGAGGQDVLLMSQPGGDPVRIHVFGASNEQNQMFSVEQHEWPIEPFMRGADRISVVKFAGSETIDAFIPAADGPYRMAGDYVWGNQRLPYSQSGQWGYLRVLPAGDQRILTLAGAALERKQAAALSFTQGLTAVFGLK